MICLVMVSYAWRGGGGICPPGLNPDEDFFTVLVLAGSLP